MSRDYRAPLTVAGIIFALFALLHLIRLFTGWGVVVGTFSIPLWWSAVGVIVAGALAAWMFTAACCDRCFRHSMKEEESFEKRDRE